MVDIVASNMLVSEERSQIADFPYPLPEGKLISILSKTKLLNKFEFSTIFSILPKLIWYLIIISFVIIFILNLVMKKITDKNVGACIFIDYLSMILMQGQ